MVRGESTAKAQDGCHAENTFVLLAEHGLSSWCPPQGRLPDRLDPAVRRYGLRLASRRQESPERRNSSGHVSLTPKLLHKLGADISHLLPPQRQGRQRPRTLLGPTRPQPSLVAHLLWLEITQDRARQHCRSHCHRRQVGARHERHLHDPDLGQLVDGAVCRVVGIRHLLERRLCVAQLAEARRQANLGGWMNDFENEAETVVANPTTFLPNVQNMHAS